MGLVPCPNNGACGSRSHNQKSARYRECLASARFSGRGTSVSGMIVPKTSSPGNLDIPLSRIRGYEDRVTVQGIRETSKFGADGTTIKSAPSSK